MLHVIKAKWRDVWHVYDIDTGGTVWLASFKCEADAINWVCQHYNDGQ